MIDLHCHSIYSDGEFTPNELLKKSEELKLNYFSITDHNNCFAYEDIDKSQFTGNLITGVEIVTSFEKHIIEILGYGIEIEEINNWCRKGVEKERRYAKIIYERLINIFEKNGISYTENKQIDNIIKQEDPTGLIKQFVYNDLLKYNNNKKVIGDEILSSYSAFNKNGLNNPNSLLFVNEFERFPEIKEVVDIIHKNKGLCFLAHLYQYNVENHIDFLNKILKEVELDGVETYHSSFTKKQIIEINDYADKINLYKSGGSDYHGRLKPGIKLGLDLTIPEEIIKPWIKKINI